MSFKNDIKNQYNIDISRKIDGQNFALVNVFKFKQDAEKLGKTYRTNKNRYRIIPVNLVGTPPESVIEKLGYDKEDYVHYAFFRELKG